MIRNCTCALGALLALAVSLSCPAGEPAKPETPLDRAKRLAVSEKKPERVQALGLLKAMAKPGTAGGDEATWRYAELCLRLHREGETGALDEARKAFESLEKSAGSRWGLRGKIGLLRVAAAGGRREEAVKGLDRFLGQQTKCERAVEAAYYLGCIYADRKPGEKDEADQLRLARTSLGYALKLHEAVSRYNVPVVSAEEIRRKLEAVKRRLWEIDAGRLKVLFEKAEALRRGKKYDDAIRIYEEIRKEFPGHDLTELSGLWICECTFQKKDLQGAIAKAKVFIAEDPLGAYRGHAHLLIGDIHLEHLFDIANSEPEFRCVLEPEKAQPSWVAQERRRLLAAKKPDPDAPPAAEVAHKTWADRLPEAHERVGIIEYVRKRPEKSAEHFQKSFELRPDKSYGEGVPTGMALVAEKIRNKEQIVPDFLLGAANERAALVLVMASIYFEGWKYAEAQALYYRVAEKDLSKNASQDQRAFAVLRMGSCASLDGNRSDEAISWYNKFNDKEYRQSVFAAEAFNQWGCLLSRTCKSDEAKKMFEKAFTLYPNHPRASTALYNRAFSAYCSESSETALAFFRLYLERYPRAPGVERARRMIDRIRREMAEEAAKKKSAPAGGV